MELLLRGRPASQSPLEFLLESTRLIVIDSADGLERAQRSRRLILKTPALRDRHRGVLADLEVRLARGLTAKGASKEQALRLRILVAAYLAAMSTAMNARLENRPRGSPVEQIEKVARMLREGFADPR